MLIFFLGAMTSPDLSIDCIDLQFQTNHLGHFALTSGLLKKKCLASNSRIINVSSCMHWFGKS